MLNYYLWGKNTTKRKVIQIFKAPYIATLEQDPQKNKFRLTRKKVKELLEQDIEHQLTYVKTGKILKHQTIIQYIDKQATKKDPHVILKKEPHGRKLYLYRQKIENI